MNNAYWRERLAMRLTEVTIQTLARMSNFEVDILLHDRREPDARAAEEKLRAAIHAALEEN